MVAEETKAKRDQRAQYPLRLQPRQVERLRQLSKKQDIPISALVRRAVFRMLDEELGPDES